MRHLPLWRLGRAHSSLDVKVVTDPDTGRPLAGVSQSLPGMFRRDLGELAAAGEVLGHVPLSRRLEIMAEAGRLFALEALELEGGGPSVSLDEHVNLVSMTGGLPHELVRESVKKIEFVLTRMPDVLQGHSRGLDLSELASGIGRAAGRVFGFRREARALGVVLPSNAPGVNGLWLPALALGVPVLLKPGRDDPWTPWRLLAALRAAGLPGEALGLYPGPHDLARAMIDELDRCMLFGDAATVDPHRGRRSIQCHGPGHSKVVVGPDVDGTSPLVLGVIEESVLSNSGRSCVNASLVLTAGDPVALATALGERLAGVPVVALSDSTARLAGFRDAQAARRIDDSVEESCREPGVIEVTALTRVGPRLARLGAWSILRPTVLHCDSVLRTAARRELPFPYVCVVGLEAAEISAALGPTLALTAITSDPALIDSLVACRTVDRLALGLIPTCRVPWDQPHEGNLFDLLFTRRAFARGESSVP